MSRVILDKRDQLGKIKRMLMPGEFLYAVYDMKGGGTGFIFACLGYAGLSF
jgi:hypothetical protein